MFSLHALRINRHRAPSPSPSHTQIQIRTLYFCGPKTGSYQPPYQHKGPQHYWAREKSEGKAAGTDEGSKAAGTMNGMSSGQRKHANADADDGGKRAGKEEEKAGEVAGAKKMGDGDWEI